MIVTNIESLAPTITLSTNTHIFPIDLNKNFLEGVKILHLALMGVRYKSFNMQKFLLYNNLQ